MSEIQFPVLWYNEEYVEKTKPLFSALSRNVNYGDGIFETLRVKKDKIYFWDFHYQRLQKGIRTIGLVQDSILQSKTQLHDIILEVVQRNNVKSSVKVKIQVFRGDETGTVTPVNHFTHTFIFCVEELSDTYSLSAKSVIVYSDVFLQYSVLSSIKTLNRLPYILAGIHAQKHQADDAILLNTKQQLTESTNSNLFYIMDKQLCTPPISSGCLDGVMRKVIIQHFDVTEKTLNIKDIKNVESIYMTNVIRGVTSVSSCKGLNKTFDTNHFFIKNILDLVNTL